MRVNWKTVLLLPGLFSILIVLVVGSGCSKTDLSGSLVFVSGDADSGLKGSDPDVIVVRSIGHGIESLVKDPVRGPETTDAAAAAGAAVQAGKSRGRAPDVVPDEIIVKYRPGVDPRMLAKGPVSQRYTETRSDRNTQRGVTSLLRLSGTARGILSEKAVRDLTLSEIERIRANPLVEHAEPNYIYRAFFTPNDTDYPLQWHYPLIDLDEVWGDASLPAGLLDLSGITVAVIDTGIAGGVSSTHPDLTDTPNLFRDQYDFYGASLVPSGDGDGDATDDGTTYHGTHVTGTIAALTNNGTGIASVAGGSGSGKGARIMPLRALSDDGGTVFDIAQAILYAAKLPNALSVLPSQKAEIINMSLGGTAASQTLADAIRDAYNADLVIVAAAGNEATDLPSYPAAYPEVISVGAVTPGAEKAYYSNFRSGFGGKVDISAPGGCSIDKFKIDLNFDTYADDVLSTFYTGSLFNYAYAAGTSMAAPHAAGAAALVLRALRIAGNPSPQPAQVKGTLASTASPLGFADFYGAGLIDVYRAVNTALVSSPGVPVLSASPKTIRLYGNPPRGDFTVKNSGKAQDIDVTVTVKSQPAAGFISVSPGSATIPSGSDGLSFTVTASPALFPPSLRYAAIEITSPDAATERVYVMHKDTGSVYVVVFEVTSFSPFTTVPVMAVTASPYDDFRYSSSGFGEGYYLLGASTDRDRDGLIFDAGEAYGFYGAPDYEHATLISLGGGETLTELNFQIIDWE